VYYQWRGTSPGELTDENVLKQMVAAIPRWARRKSLEAADRAEQLLERLIQEALAGNPRIRIRAESSSSSVTPVLTNTSCTGTASNLTNTTAITKSPPIPLSVSLFNAAMDAYGKIGHPEGVQRILRRMDQLRKKDANFDHLCPDEFSMSILATAWAKSRSLEAAQKAEAILQYMDVNELVPNTITYNAVLNAIAVGNQVDKALKAEDIVQRMKQRHEEKGEDCAPDVYTYQSLIQAWSRTPYPGAPQKAEEVLRYMDEASEKNKSLKPNAYCFTTVIHAWSRSLEKNRARSAYQLLNIMTRRCHEIQNNSGKKSNLLKPNVKTFTAVLNACARPIEEAEKEDAFAIAQLTMAELSLGAYGKPNFLSFAAFLSVCATTLEPGPERDEIVKSTFEDCVKAGQVGQIVLEKLYVAASSDLFHQLVGEYRDEKGQIHIPKQWNSHIDGERAGGNPFFHVDNGKQDGNNIPKSSVLRLQAVKEFGGKSGAYSRSHSGTMVLEEDGEPIIWSKDGFSQTTSREY